MKKMSYQKKKERQLERQSKMNYEEIKEQMQKRSEFLLELDKLPTEKHIWIDRGLKMTCEHAGHAAHEAWKKR